MKEDTIAVRELIKALEKVPQDLPVYYADAEYGHEPVEAVTVVEADERTDLSSYCAEWALPKRLLIG